MTVKAKTTKNLNICLSLNIECAAWTAIKSWCLESDQNIEVNYENLLQSQLSRSPSSFRRQS